MHVEPGTRLGPYEVTGAIGAGGMGEVYRARDTRLGREVAIKVLPRNVSRDAARLARFEREARSASALNHRNIVTIHDFSTTDGEAWLVMELVRGESLREIAGRGPLPLKRLTAIGAGIADGLAAAHEAGIIHRDLKPENVIVAPDGTPKILDFGLVKQIAASDPNSPTEHQLSRAGEVMGTVGYMSPEQARGAALDFRTDQFSLGLILYEMATGKHPFARRTGADTLAAILNDEHEPLGSNFPEAFVAIVERCLSKSAKDRYGSTADLAHDLARINEISGRSAVAARPGGKTSNAWRWIALAAIIVAAGAAILALTSRQRSDDSRSPAIHASIAIPEIEELLLEEVGVPIALSPNGHHLLVNGAGTDGRGQLLLYDLQTGSSRVLVQNAFAGAWSSDSRSVAYYADGKLKTIPIGGGPAHVLCDAAPEGKPSWSGDNILFAQYSKDPAIYRVSANGGSPEKLLPLGVTKDAVMLPWWPEFLPDGQHFLAVRIVNRPGQGQVAHEVVISDLAGHARLVSTTIDSRVVYVEGNLLYVREGALVAQPFDPDKGKLSGEAQPLTDHLYYFRNTGNAAFSVSQNGVLAWCSARRSSRLVWIDRSGATSGAIASGVFAADARVSPEGKRVAATVIDSNGAGDVWIYDLTRDTAQRLTLLTFDEKAPVWSTDGNSIYYRTDGYGPPDMAQWRLGDDHGAPIYHGPAVEVPEDVSPDGKSLLYVVETSSGQDIRILPLSPPGAPRDFAATQFDEQSPRFSPDGKFVAYSSDVSGQPEIYVRPFDGGGAVRVSKDGGTRPRWARDGTEIFFLGSDFRVFAAPFTRGVPGIQSLVFRTAGAVDFEPDAGGKRFLVQIEDRTTEPPIHIMTNWRERLRSHDGSATQ